ncbi:MAG: serine hydrolase [Flavobacteriales bacterium]|nr:serine hydrolase [Flavobacteriales bacterium]
MKIQFYYLFFLLSFQICQAQNEKTAAVMKSIQEEYNSNRFEQLFEQFSPEMQSSLPLPKTTAFFTQLQTDAGQLVATSFVKNMGNGYEHYKGEFEKGDFSIFISLDESQKINGLGFRPFVQESDKKRINTLTDYPSFITTSFSMYTNDFPEKTQLSVAIIRKGIVDFYGMIIRNDSIKYTENHEKVFEIGSITKVFTSTVFAELIQAKKIKADSYLHTYYPFDFHDSTPIQLIQLSNHTSGLPRLPENLNITNEANPYRTYSEKELNTYLEKIVMLKKSDSPQYEYSNLGAGLLGHTLGLSQKKPFTSLLQENIFAKYGMKNTYVHPKSCQDIRINGLNPEGREVENWEFDVLFGGGGILSTTTDLATFVKAHFNPKNKTLALTRKPTFTVNETMQVGMGWHIFNSPKEEPIHWHTGGTGGYSSCLVMNVKSQNAVIILSNVSAFHPQAEKIEQLSFEILKQLEE